MDVPTLLAEVRRRSGLSKRALARKAGTSAAALVEYERGRRSPTVATLDRILAAAGFAMTADLRPVRAPQNLVAQRLVEVLALAEALPQRAPERELPFPRFPEQ